MLANFSWVIPGLLAGAALPGNGGSGLAEDLQELRRLGIRHLVSLTDAAERFGPACVRAGLVWEYFPIPEFDIPEDAGAFHELVERLLARLSAGQAVGVHCYAGVGRTGLLLACLLGRYHRLGAAETIRRLRLLRPALETADQERFVHRYLARIAARGFLL